MIYENCIKGQRVRVVSMGNYPPQFIGVTGRITDIDPPVLLSGLTDRFCITVHFDELVKVEPEICEHSNFHVYEPEELEEIENVAGTILIPS